VFNSLRSRTVGEEEERGVGWGTVTLGVNVREIPEDGAVGKTLLLEVGYNVGVRINSLPVGALAEPEGWRCPAERPPPPTPPPRPGQIPDANRPVVLSLLSSYEFCLPIDLGIALDNDVSTHDGVGVLYEVVPLRTGGVSAVPFDLRCDDDDGDRDSGGGDRDWRTMVSQMLICLTDAGDGVVSQSSMDRPLVIGLLSSRSMVGGGKNDVTDG